MGRGQPAVAVYIQWKIGGQLSSQVLQMGGRAPASSTHSTCTVKGATAR